MSKCYRFFFLLAIFVCEFAWAGAYPLPADQAFVFSVPSITTNGISLHWQIAPGYHLYKDRISVGEDKSTNAQLGKIDLPAGAIATDDPSGPAQEYQGQLSINVPITGSAATPIILLVNYQGCQDNGICYPPISKQVSFNLTTGATAQISAQQTQEEASATTATSATTQSSTDTSSDQMVIYGFPVKSFIIILLVVACVLFLVIRRSSSSQSSRR